MNTYAEGGRKTFKKIDAPMTPEIAEALKRYLEIQRQDRENREEKSRLQDVLAGYLSSGGDGFWYPEVDGQALKIRFARETEVEYDENLLRSRLGDRYRHILKPDPRKIKDCLPDLERVLEPVMEMIGVPDRAKVKTAVENGLVAKEEFAGAFKKVPKTRLAVMKRQPGEG